MLTEERMKLKNFPFHLNFEKKKSLIVVAEEWNSLARENFV